MPKVRNKITNDNITELLIGREWAKQESTSKYDVFIPPRNLNFLDDYKLYIFNKNDNSTYEKEIIKSLTIISQIYDEDLEELISIVIEDRQILSLHVENSDIKDAKPNLPFFYTMLHKSKQLLQEVANFSVIQKPHYFEGCEEAERYLNQCNFFKNESGSLITKIQLPNKEEIKEGTLFETGIVANEINKNLIDITEFFNTEILQQDPIELSDDFLKSRSNHVSVNVSDKLKELYIGLDYADVSMSLKGTNIHQTSTATGLSRNKVEHLTTFSKTVREKIKEIEENKFSGKIIRLESKDVDGDKNKIILEGEIKKIKSKISINLNSHQIKLASEAFKNNRKVSVNAILEKKRAAEYVTIELKELKPLD